MKGTYIVILKGEKILEHMIGGKAQYYVPHCHCPFACLDHIGIGRPKPKRNKELPYCS
jgi:hypothetical protein